MRGVLLVVPSIDPGQEEALDALLSAATTRPVVRAVARVIADVDTDRLPAFCLVVESDKGGLFALVHGDVVLEARSGDGDQSVTRLNGLDAHSWVDRTLPVGLTHLLVRAGSRDGGRLVLEAVSSSRAPGPLTPAWTDTPGRDTPGSSDALTDSGRAPADSGRAVINSPAPASGHSGSSPVGFRPEPIRFGESGRMETATSTPVPQAPEVPQGKPTPSEVTSVPDTILTSTRSEGAPAAEPSGKPAKKPTAKSGVKPPAEAPPPLPSRPASSTPAPPPLPSRPSTPVPPPPVPSPPARPTPAPPPVPSAATPTPPEPPVLPQRLGSGLPVRRPKGAVPPAQPPTQVVPPPASPTFDPFGALSPRPPDSDAPPAEPGRKKPARSSPLGRLIMDDGPDIVVDADCVIGRNPEVDVDVAQGRAKPVILPDAEQRISRVHARLVYADDGVEIVDAGSVNGTWIEPPGGAGWIAMVPRVPAPLPLGSRIQVGDLVLSYAPMEDDH
ncbi:MAG: hypothetical protein QG622_2443 [Actinomycetota bacterium]|nr:hypothetical protein [Actinomycetota bacterium]